MTKQLSCREHGGTFTVEVRRGRPPVRCSAENPCSNGVRVTSPVPNSRITRTTVTKVATQDQRKTLAEMDMPELKAYARSLGMSTGTKLTNRAQLRNAIRRYQSPVGESRTTVAPEVAQEAPAKAPRRVRVPEGVTTVSVAKATAARELLEVQGWHCTAQRGKVLGAVELTATRGIEVLILVWEKTGALISQSYTMWDTMKPSKNDAPAHELPFDPDEMPDRELIQAMAGMQVTWWNRIASSRETAIVSPDKVSITHAYNGTGDEVPGDRVITFVDHSGSGFRSFRAAALLKIGK